MSRRGRAGLPGVSALLLVLPLLLWPAIEPDRSLAGTAEAARAPVPPRPTGSGARPVVDQAGVLSPDEKARLEATLGRLYRATGITAGVLTVRSTAPEPIEPYTQRVFDTWRLGRAGRDDGLLLVVAVEDRHVRLQTGYAIEPVLPDGRIGELLDRHAVPAFRTGAIGAGILSVMEAAAAVLAAEAPTGPPREGAARTPGGTRTTTWILVLLLLAVALSVILGGRGGRGPGSGVRHLRRRGPIIVPGGFGGFGGASRGGGFGGFGGRSGGGGASRGW